MFNCQWGCETVFRALIDSLDPSQPVLIAGPTASGKSALALEIAQRQGGTVVNADALQVFSDWRILTARPDDRDLARAPHALYGHVSGTHGYSVGEWLRDVAALPRDTRPILVGGTGLYFSALTEGLAEVPPIPDPIRQEAMARVAAGDHAVMLAELDAETAGRIDRDNPMRIQRAWEVFTATGRGLADWQRETPAPLVPLNPDQAIVLRSDKDWLEARIAMRFDQMVAQGVLEEARANRAGWSPDLPSSKAIGARELIQHLDGEIDIDETRAAVIVQTRQYAKRQRSWFRSRMKAWRWIDVDG